MGGFLSFDKIFLQNKKRCVPLLGNHHYKPHGMLGMGQQEVSEAVTKITLHSWLDLYIAACTMKIKNPTSQPSC